MADPAVEVTPADPAPPAILAEQFKSLTADIQAANDRVKAALDQQKKDIAEFGGISKKTQDELDAATKSFVQVQADLGGVAEKCASLGTRLDNLELDLREGRFGTKATEQPAREDVASQLYAQLAANSAYMSRIKSGERVGFEIDDFREGRKAVVMTDAATRMVVPDRKPIVMPDRQPTRVADLFSQDNLQGIAIEYLRYLGMGPNGGIVVSGITRSGTTATATTSAAHGIVAGDLVQVQGATQTDYNITAYVLTVPSSTTFTYTVANSPTTPATTSTAIAVLNLFNHGGAVPLGEGVAAPEAAAAFSLMSAKLKEVAHQIPISLLALENVDGLRNVLDQELLFGLDLMVDRALLYATGSDSTNAPQLQGILTAADIQTYSWSAGANAAANTVGDTMLDAIRRAQTRLSIWGRMASALIINPFDKEKIDLIKTTAGEYIWSEVATGPGTTVWLTPVVETPSIAVGTACIGDFKAAATLYSKKAGQIFVGTVNTQFIQRQLTLMAVWQGLLAVQRPRAIVKINFDSAPA